MERDGHFSSLALSIIGLVSRGSLVMPEKVEDQKKGYVFQAIMIALTFFIFVASCDPSEYTAMGWLVLFVVVTIFVGGFAYSVRKAMQFR